MSILTIAWSMCGAASFMLSLLHLLLWSKDREARVYLLSAVMTFGAGASALAELALMSSESIDAYRAWIRWENLFVFLILVPMVWFVRIRLPGARRGLALLITAMWSVAIVANWWSPSSIVYSEINALKQMPTLWGEQFTIALGTPNPWVHLANLATVLIVFYVVDAAIRTWRNGDARKAILVGGGVAVFIVLGGVHAPLVDSGVLEMPYMVSFAFLAIVLALSYELVSEAVLASHYARAIQVAETRWRTLLTNVELAVIGIDPQGKVSYANPFLQRLTGYSSDELLGRPITTLLPEADHAEARHRLELAARCTPRAHSRWDLICARGERRSLAWSSVRLSHDDGRYAGLLSIGEDVTPRLRAERDLERTRRELERVGRANVLGELVSALAHELNQPLAAILSNAQAAQRFIAAGEPDLAELRAILNDIVEDDKRAGQVIHRLRLMLRKDQPERERLSVAETLAEVIGLVQPELDSQGVSAQVELDPNLPPILADRVEVHQVLMNLLVNSVRALAEAPAGPRQIWISGVRTADQARISVEDTGPGVPEEALPRLFEPFFTTRPGGLGIGLALCRRIVEAHGGTIWAENTENGARLTFTLPQAPRGDGHD